MGVADGLISIRQDEGGPKLLHGYEPKLRQFRGGAGWLAADGNLLASTRCPAPQSDGGACSGIDIRFGVGMTSKTGGDSSRSESGSGSREGALHGSASGGLSQAVQAPFGDFPFLVSEVNASISESNSASISDGGPGNTFYTEVWATLAQELLPGGWNTEASAKWTHDVQALCVSPASSGTSTAAGHVTYTTYAAAVDRAGAAPPCSADAVALLLFDAIASPGLSSGDFARRTGEAEPARAGSIEGGWPVAYPTPSLHDASPKPLYFALLAPAGSTGIDFAGCSVSSNGTAVFPDPDRPDLPGVMSALDGTVGGAFGASTVLAIQSPLSLFPDDMVPASMATSSITNAQMYFVSGYVPPGNKKGPKGAIDALAPLLAARQSPGGVRAWLAEGSRKFARTGIRFRPDPTADPEAAAWATREQVWQAGYTRGAMSYDSFWQGFLINQAGVYQYYNGFQGAIRDPLGHVAPLVFNNHFPVKSGGNAIGDVHGAVSRGETVASEAALGRGSTMEMVRFSVQQADAAWTMPWGLQAFG